MEKYATGGTTAGGTARRLMRARCAGPRSPASPPPGGRARAPGGCPRLVRPRRPHDIPRMIDAKTLLDRFLGSGGAASALGRAGGAGVPAGSTA